MHPVASFVELDLNSLRVSSLPSFLDFLILLPLPVSLRSASDCCEH